MYVTNLIGCFILLYMLMSIESLCASFQSELEKEDEEQLQKMFESELNIIPAANQAEEEEEEELQKKLENIKIDDNDGDDETDDVSIKKEDMVVRRRIKKSVRDEHANKRFRNKEECKKNKSQSKNDSESDKDTVSTGNKEKRLKIKRKIPVQNKNYIKFNNEVDDTLNHFKEMVENSITLNYSHLTQNVNPFVVELFNDALTHIETFYQEWRTRLEDLKDMLYPAINNSLDVESLKDLDEQYDSVHSLLWNKNKEFSATLVENILYKNPIQKKDPLKAPKEELFKSLKLFCIDFKKQLRSLEEDLSMIESVYPNMNKLLHKVLYTTMHNMKIEVKFSLFRNILDNFKLIIREASVANKKKTSLKRWNLIFNTYCKMDDVIELIESQIRHTNECIKDLLIFENMCPDKILFNLLKLFYKFLLTKNAMGKRSLRILPQDIREGTMAKDLYTIFNTEEGLILEYCDRSFSFYSLKFQNRQSSVSSTENDDTDVLSRPLGALPYYLVNLISLNYFLSQFKHLKSLLDAFIGMPFNEKIEQLQKQKEKDNKPLEFEIQVNENIINFLKFNFQLVHDRMSNILLLEKIEYKFSVLCSRIKEIRLSFHEISLYLDSVISAHNLLMNQVDHMDEEEVQSVIKNMLRSLYFIYKTITIFE